MLRSVRTFSWQFVLFVLAPLAAFYFILFSTAILFMADVDTALALSHRIASVLPTLNDETKKIDAVG
jgi:hypothetical protein